MTEHEAVTTARSDLDAWRESVWQDRFDRDLFFGRLLRRRMGVAHAEWESRLRRVAEESGAQLNELVMESSRDEHLPSLRRQDADGRPTEAVLFHPAYHEVGRVFWSSGVLAVLAKPGSAVASGAIVYLLDQHGEAGHACPVACTSGAVKLLQALGTEEQRTRYLPSLLETDYDRRCHAAQYVTELQGGSDVGLNACKATPEAGRPGWYRISGEKWFCSVADAGLFVVSARPEGAPAGTKGLGLFLVPRLIDGRPNGFALRRLKGKLGTRSMATGEIEFDGALGEAIGPLQDGFRNLVGIVLDTSRVHNALAACGLMRRALVEAHGFARHRLAFDRRIIDFPAVREILARMKVRTMAGLASTFRILEMSDRLDETASDELAAARRIAVMINKYWTALAGTRTVRDGIEVLGGNGTIEEFSVLPRLYRDAIVVESWEGTHNTLCAQVLRDFVHRGLHGAWLRRLETEIEDEAHPELADPVARARELHGDVSERIDRLLAADEPTAAAHVRHVVDRMCRLTDWVALLTQARWDLDHDEGAQSLDALAWYRLHELERIDPQDSTEITDLNARLASEP
jgi:alkylation response protein AidB-like acyl-CoA dehydrogenase